MDKRTKILLARIVDRCDNTMCNLSSTHPKHLKYFDLFHTLANIATSIAGEEDILWWKRYTNNKVNYDKVFYNRDEILKILIQLPEDIKKSIVEGIKNHPAADFLLNERKKEELMRMIVEEFSEKDVRGVKEEEIFWEYKIRKIGNTFYVHLYPRKEWGMKIETSEIVYETIHGHKIIIYGSTIERQLQETVKSFKNCFMHEGEIELIFEDNPNIHEDIKKAILKLNRVINEEREKAEKIAKELGGIAVPWGD